MKLTDSAIRGLKPAAKRYSKADGAGLSIEVLPTGKKVFKLAYRANGKQRNRTLGPYPLLKLAQARTKRDDIKRSLIMGEDPQPGRTALSDDVTRPKDETWRDMCDKLLDRMRQEEKSPRTVRSVENKLGKTYPYFGEKALTEVKAADLLEVCKDVESKGHFETANRLRSAAGRVCRYAIALGKMEYDISSVLRGALVQPNSKGFPGLTEDEEVGVLLRAIWSYPGSFITRSALQLTAMTWLRTTELRKGRWDEIDWDNQTWVIPAERMKIERKHYVPLSLQAVSVLRKMQALTSHKSELIFPSIGGKKGRAMSENTTGHALHSLGFKGKHVPHGFRTTASTNLNEQGWDERWIEKQLAHEDNNRTRRAYNAAEYFDDRRRMMQHYSDWLDKVRLGSTTQDKPDRRLK